MDLKNTLGITGIPWALTTVLLLVVLIGCGQRNEYQEPPPPKVTVAKPVQTSVTTYLEETGTTEAVEMAEVRARVKGFLDEIRFEPNQEVEKDKDILYVIEKREFQAIVNSAEAHLEAVKVVLNKAQIEYERQEALFKENATSDMQVVAAKAERDVAEAAIDVAQAELEQKQIDLDYTDVVAPISGHVGKTLVKVGNLVDGAEATHLTTIVDYDPIYANFNISERDLLKILDTRRLEESPKRDKKEVKFQLRRRNDKEFLFDGHLDFYAQKVDESTGTFKIRGVFPNPDEGILPGLFCDIRIPIDVQDNALLVPELALGSDQAGTYLLVVNSENQVERKDVSPGVKLEELIVIREGLQADDWVIIDGVQRSRPGAKVDPQQTELDAPEGDITAVKKGTSPPPEDQPADPEDPAGQPVSEQTSQQQDAAEQSNDEGSAAATDDQPQS